MSKEQIVLFIFFYLLIKNQWNIIAILVFIYLFYSMNNPMKTNISEEVKLFSEQVSKDNYYYNKFMNLEKLKDKYPLKLIRYEQLKIINSMIQKIPITDELHEKWYNLKKELI